MTDSEDKPSRVGEVKYTKRAPPQRRSQAVGAPVRTLLVVPPSELTPARASDVAGRLGVSVRRVQELAKAGQAIPVAAGLRGRAVQTALQEEPLDVVPEGMPGVGLPVLGAGGLLAGAGMIVVSAALGLLSALAAVAVAVTGGAVILASLAPFVLWLLQVLTYRRAVSTWRLLEQAGRQAREHELVGEARDRAAAIRVHLARSELPELALADIRSGLTEIEDDLDTLAQSWDQLPDGAGGEEARTSLRQRVEQVERGLIDLRATLTSSTTQASDQAGSTLRDTIAAAQLAVDGLRR